MNRFVITLSFLVFSLPLSAREVYNINRGWKFSSDAAAYAGETQEINLPHTWNLDALGGKKDYFRGTGSYVKEIIIPSDWEKGRVFIKCYGANTVSDVLVNGRHVGEHRAGYTAFAYEITEFLNFGRRNTLRIIVNNSPRFDVLPAAGDATSYGGIFRDVELIVTGKEAIAVTDYASEGVYITQKKVTVSRAEAEASVRINGTEDKTVAVHLAVFTDGMDTVAAASANVKLKGGETVAARIPFAVDNPRLWKGLDDPYLYNVSVKITDRNITSDSVALRTGFRSFSADKSGGFLLNGEPYPIKGVISRQDRAMAGAAISVFDVAEDVDLILSMGANAVRVAGVSHHPRFYELCDEKGLIVWSDIPFTGSYHFGDTPFIDTEALRENGIVQLAETIYQQYNHPSIVMWGLFSDLRSRAGDDPAEFVSRLNAAAKKYDPSRLTVASSSDDGKINFITDLIVWDHHFGWREGSPSDIRFWKDRYRSNWSDLKAGISYSAGGSIRHQGDLLTRPPFMGSWHPERWQTHLHEVYMENLRGDSLFWGVFVGNMFDYGAAGQRWGEGNGINDKGLVTFDRKTCKDAYYLYKANWNERDKFVYLSERRWNRRREHMQRIKVYSNCSEVELSVNGVPQGTVNGHHGIFIWEADLRKGKNLIEARCGELYDSAVIEITGHPPYEIY